MSRPTKLLLLSLAVAGAISVGVLGFDLALVGAIALAISIVILAVQLAIKFLLKPAIDSEQHGAFNDSANTAREHVDVTTEDRGAYNAKHPMVPFHWDPP